MGANRAVLGALTMLGVLLATSACIFGGDDATGADGVIRRGPIATATVPATLSEPLELGASQGATTATAATPGVGGAGGTYTVGDSETLGGIASSLGVPPDQQQAWINEVMRLNGITDVRLLRAGQEITIPRTSAAAGSTPSPTTVPSAQATPAPTATRPPATGGAGTYTVVDGDNPSVIGEKLGVPAGQLAAWAAELLSLNNTTANGLQVGQVLQLPPSTPR